MKILNKRALWLALPLALTTACTSSPDIDIETTKEERNLLNEGLKAYNDSAYNEALIAFTKALSLSPTNPITQYNLSTTEFQNIKPQLGQMSVDAGGGIQNQLDSILSSTVNRFATLTEGRTDSVLVFSAAYNLGNLFYTKADYDSSIKYYKRALRNNPDDNQARVNLRLAQLKKQQQDNNDNQDQQNQQDKQDQQDKDNDQNQDQQNPQQQPPTPQQTERKGLPANSQQMLKAMENAEQRTRQKVDEKEQEQAQSNRQNKKPW